MHFNFCFIRNISIIINRSDSDIFVGVNDDVAEQDAEGVEHHVSEQTLSKFKEFLKIKL